MIIKNNFLPFLFVLLFANGFVSVFAQEQTGSINGTVKSEEGFPVSGAIVQDSLGSWSTQTDQTGTFYVSDIQTGFYTIIIKALGYNTYITRIRIENTPEPVYAFILKSIVYEMPQVTIIEKRSDALTKIPGSVSRIYHDEILNIDPISGNEVLRKVPGVHVVDEEGGGLRMNLGIRGTDPDRSRGVLILEDGIPVALAPYGEPELYYTPAMDRMSGIEIVKGSGSILYGPQTIGGVVNFITADPPVTSQGSVTVRGGQGGYFSMLTSYGNSYNKTGYQINILHKQADDFGLLQFRVTDFSSKIKFQLNPKSVLGMKFGFYNEYSNSTYVGMTLPMYQTGLYDLSRIAPHDRLAIRRYSFSATHNYFTGSNSSLKTTIYAYTTTRNWQRQNFSYSSLDDDGIPNAKPSDYTGITWGDETLDRGAIYMRNGTGNRNRQFEVAGAETKFQKKFNLGKIKNEFSAGGRFLFERAFEQRVNGTSPDAFAGVLKEYEIRTGYGTSGYVHNRFDLSEKFSVTTGVRYENFSYDREILYGEFVINGVKTLKDTSISANSSVQQFIPGIGFNFVPSKKLTLFGGAHRGFAPPRIKDAISDGGLPYNLDAELSWNFELGSRTQLHKAIGFEATIFYMDFSNQIIPVSESSGGSGSGLVNGGKTSHTGIEGGFVIEGHKFFDTKEKFMLSANATYLNARFSEDRFVGNDMANIKGNTVPYAPELLINSIFRYDSQIGLGAQINFLYVGSQFSDVKNTIEMSNDGLSGRIPAYKVIDIMLKYNAEKINTCFTVSAKNITDERYIVSHRPQGIRVGISRYFLLGIRYNFN